MHETERTHTAVRLNAWSVVTVSGDLAGLSLAQCLTEAEVHVPVYDVMTLVGRKLLLAGKRSLKLAYSDTPSTFLIRSGLRNLQP